MKKYSSLLYAGLSFLPTLVFAQGLGNTLNLIIGGQTILSRLIPIAAGLALLVFIFGIVKYIWAQGNEGAKADGKKIMLGGVIALFVLFSVWGIVGFLSADLLGTGVGGPPINPPKINF